MINARLVIGLVATAGSLLAVVACSSSTTGTATGGDGGASSTSSSSSSGSSGSTSSSGGPKQCPSSSSSTCTDAELKTYSDCLVNACDSNFAMCYGPNYKTGTYDGVCGSYITCTQACACGDTACLTKCTLPPACSSCLQGFGTCSAKCTAPACETGGSSGSSGSSGTSGSSGGATHTCADLQTCCDNLPAGSDKDTCNAEYNAASGAEAACNAIYTALKCP